MNKTVTIAIAMAMLALGAAGGYWIATQRPNLPAANAPGAAAEETGSKPGRQVLYWHDPMVPGQRFDKPGRSPFMDMDLVPVYADLAGDAGTITIDPRVQQNLGVRTVEVVRRPLAPKVEVVGAVAYDERAVALVSARTTGFIDKLYLRAPFEAVRAGQPLAEILAPEWVAAQEEYLALAATGVPGAEALRRAARQRLMVLGMPEETLRALEADGKVRPRVVLTAPISGVIGELSVREGMTAIVGMPLLRINGLATVWVNAEVPEAQAARVRPGHAVAARVAAYPGEIFKGRVAALLPEVSATTRTLKARIELANPKGRLSPGMFATVELTPATTEDALLVPTEALIQTGKRQVILLALDGGKFRPVEVETGFETDGLTVISKGLEAGQKVVVSSQFLIDSEASLKATFGRMEGAEAAAAPRAERHRGEGVVEAIGEDELTLSHGPIPSLNWGAMTMGFKRPVGGLLPEVEVGERVVFEFSTNAKGEYELAAIAPQAAGQGARR